MPARLSLTDVQRTALLTLPETEEAFVRHYSLNEDDRAAVLRCRTPQTELAFALQLCVLRYPGRVLRRGEIIPFPLLAFIADQIEVSPDAIAGLRAGSRHDPSIWPCSGSASGSRILPARTGRAFRTWLAPLALRTADGLAVMTALLEEMRWQRMIIPGVTVVERLAARAMDAADLVIVRVVVRGCIGRSGDPPRSSALRQDPPPAKSAELVCVNRPAACAPGAFMKPSTGLIWFAGSAFPGRAGQSNGRPAWSRWRVKASVSPLRPFSR